MPVNVARDARPPKQSTSNPRPVPIEIAKAMVEEAATSNRTWPRCSSSPPTPAPGGASCARCGGGTSTNRPARSGSKRRIGETSHVYEKDTKTRERRTVTLSSFALDWILEHRTRHLEVCVLCGSELSKFRSSSPRSRVPWNHCTRRARRGRSAGRASGWSYRRRSTSTGCATSWSHSSSTPASRCAACRAEWGTGTRRRPRTSTRTGSRSPTPGPPAPPDREFVPQLIGELVSTLDTTSDTDDHAVLRAAMTHLNPVMIHPFSDGNGRIARHRADGRAPDERPEFTRARARRASRPVR